MRIGIILSKTPSYSETFFISKIEGLKASGFNVILFVQKDEHNFSLCEVRTVSSLKNKSTLQQLLSVILSLFTVFFYAPSRFFKFIKLERDTKRSWSQVLKNIYNNSHLLTSRLDWLHFGFATIALQSENVPKTIDAKMAVSFRGYDIDVYPLINPDCYHLLWKNLDQVHSISNYLLTKAYQLGMPKTIPVHIIHPAVNLSQFETLPKTDFSKHEFLTVARLHWIKALDTTLEAMALLKKEGIKFHYNIVGEGPEHESLNKLVKRLQLENEVTLIGKKAHEEVITYYNEANYYIQYSESEGFCNSVLEAQTKGLLCIVSNGGGLPENVINNKTGWVVPKKNSEQLINTILKIIALPNHVKKRVSEAAQNRIVTEFSIDAQHEKFRLFYETN